MSYNKKFTNRRFPRNSDSREKRSFDKFLQKKRRILPKKSTYHNYGNRKESVYDQNKELHKFLREKRKESNDLVDAINDGVAPEEPVREQDQNKHLPRFSKLYSEKIAMEKKNNPHSPLHGLPDISSPEPNDINQGINNVVGNPFFLNWSDRFGPGPEASPPMAPPLPELPHPEPHQPWAKPPLPPKDGYGVHYFDGGARRTKRRKRRKYRKNRRTKCRRTKSRKKRTRRNKYKKHTKTKRGCRKSN